MEGWIKVHRKFLEWEWFNTSEMVHLFIYLLLNANNRDGSWKGYDIKRGQIIVGLRSLSKNTNISIQTIRTCLKRLEKTQEINTQVTHQFSIITICKYDDYQGEKIDTNTQTNTQLTHDQHTTNNKQEYKKEKKERNMFIKPTISQIEEYCKERNNNVSPLRFFNNYEANGWVVGKAPMKDWKAAIIKWELSSFNPKPSTSERPSPNHHMLDGKWVLVNETTIDDDTILHN